MTSIIWFANQTLFLTNLFVFTYKILLKLLNRLSPPVENPDFFSRELFAPEPFEIPLYLILSIFWVLIIFIFPRFLAGGPAERIRNLTKLRVLGWIIFLSLLILFLINIGVYPLKDDIKFIENLVHPTISFIILAAYLCTVAAIIFTAYILRRARFLLFFLILVVIGLFTFEPGFPSSPHDLSYFFGPIYEIIQGKTIFTTISSQYGFLSILILAFMTKLNIFNPFYLPYLTLFLYILQYFLCFYIIYKSSRSTTLASIGFFSILTINYFSLYHLPNTFPQVGPMRWLPLIISLFLVQRYKNITDSKLIFLFSLLSLWNVEAGIALFLSYSFTLFLLTIVGAVSKLKTIASILTFFISALTIFLILDFIHLISGRQLIDVIGAFTRLREFAIAGVAMIPIPWRTHFWFVLLIYFSTIIYVFKNTIQTVDYRRWKIDKEARGLRVEKFNLLSSIFKSPSSILYHPSSILLFSANLSLFASIYYVGRSHPHNLFHISIFFLLNTFLLISEFIRNNLSKHISKRTLYTLYLILYTAFILYPAYNRKQALASMIKTKFDRLKNPSIFKPELEQKIKQYYSIESMFIKRNLPEDEILILSVDDTYLFYLVDKKNLLFDNPQSGLASASKTDLNLTLRKASKTCPEKIATTCRLFNRCPSYKTFNHEAVNIQKILLRSLEKSCKVKYKPIKCTNKLCVASF